MLHFRKNDELADWQKQGFFQNITTAAVIAYNDRLIAFQFKADLSGTITNFRFYRLDINANDCDYTEIDINYGLDYNINTGIIKSIYGYVFPTPFENGMYEIRITVDYAGTEILYKSEPFMVVTGLSFLNINAIMDENSNPLQTESLQDILI